MPRRRSARANATEFGVGVVLGLEPPQRVPKDDRYEGSCRHEPQQGRGDLLIGRLAQAAGQVMKVAIEAVIGEPHHICQDPEGPHRPCGEYRSPEVPRTGREGRRRHELEPQTQPEHEKAGRLHDHQPAMTRDRGDDPRSVPGDGRAEAAPDEGDRPRQLAVPVPAVGDTVHDPGRSTGGGAGGQPEQSPRRAERHQGGNDDGEQRELQGRGEVLAPGRGREGGSRARTATTAAPPRHPTRQRGPLARGRQTAAPGVTESVGAGRIPRRSRGKGLRGEWRTSTPGCRLRLP